MGRTKGPILDATPTLEVRPRPRPTGAADPFDTVVLTAAPGPPSPAGGVGAPHRWRAAEPDRLATFTEIAWPSGVSVDGADSDPERMPGPGEERFRFRDVCDYLTARRRGDPVAPELRDSWDEFYRLCAPLVWAISRRRARSAAEAEDLAQEAWAELSRTLPALPRDTPERSVRLWAATVVYRKVRDARRKWLRGSVPGRACAARDVACPRTADPRSRAERDELREAVRRVVADLERLAGRSDSELVRLYAIEGHSSPQVAARLGMTPEQVRMRSLRLRRTLRSELRRFADEDIH